MGVVDGERAGIVLKEKSASIRGCIDPRADAITKINIASGY
jgi:hypothetical protein